MSVCMFVCICMYLFMYVHTCIYVYVFQAQAEAESQIMGKFKEVLLESCDADTDKVRVKQLSICYEFPCVLVVLLLLILPLPVLLSQLGFEYTLLLKLSFIIAATLRELLQQCSSTAGQEDYTNFSCSRSNVVVLFYHYLFYYQQYKYDNNETDANIFSFFLCVRVCCFSVTKDDGECVVGEVRRTIIKGFQVAAYTGQKKHKASQRFSYFTLFDFGVKVLTLYLATTNQYQYYPYLVKLRTLGPLLYLFTIISSILIIRLIMMLYILQEAIAAAEGIDFRAVPEFLKKENEIQWV